MGFRDSALRKLSNVSSKPGHLKLPSVRPPSCYVYYISYSIHKCARINYETSLICAGYHGLNVRSLPNYQAPLLAKSSSSSSSRFSFFILSFFHYCVYKQNREIYLLLFFLFSSHLLLALSKMHL